MVLVELLSITKILGVSEIYLFQLGETNNLITYDNITFYLNFCHEWCTCFNNEPVLICPSKYNFFYNDFINL